MGIIPGNENFADVKRAYGTAKVKEVYEVVAADTTGTYYKPGNYRSIWVHVIAATPANMDTDGLFFKVKSRTGVVRTMIINGGVDADDGNELLTAMCVIRGNMIPHEFAISNPSLRTAFNVSLIFNY
tara:strand:- start:444 stop:824 length:381 start_codon:yes stop_codon:yes gene_type:complete